MTTAGIIELAAALLVLSAVALQLDAVRRDWRRYEEAARRKEGASKSDPPSQ